MYIVQSKTRQCKHNAIKPVAFGTVVEENSTNMLNVLRFLGSLETPISPKIFAKRLQLPLGSMFGISRSPRGGYGTPKLPATNWKQKIHHAVKASVFCMFWLKKQQKVPEATNNKKLLNWPAFWFKQLFALARIHYKTIFTIGTQQKAQLEFK